MLRLINVSKTFNINTCNETKALIDVNLEVKNSDFITIVGGNGAGKSTLLNSIAGVFNLTEGDIILSDKNITDMPEYKRANFIGRVFQDPLMGTSPEMTIEENLSMALNKNSKLSLKWAINKYKRKKIKEHLSEIDLGLEDRLNTKVKLLSGGQRQALTLLMATIIEPEILLLDEHTAALDPATAIKIKDLTEQIIDNHNITTLMITHDMKDALRFGNRMLMMNRGKIILDVNGKTKENMTINHLLEIFQKKHKEGFYNDRSILSLA
ncbi:MAG TPA: ATP-binding cassette domain-containing protein [Halanaerobiales bacterium]|nr:ATP-binding cassette domain-containing protein [Halanaerobiales bacterium]